MSYGSSIVGAVMIEKYEMKEDKNKMDRRPWTVNIMHNMAKKMNHGQQYPYILEKVPI